MQAGRLTRWIPRLVIGAAAAHVAIGLANTTALSAIATNGFVDTLMHHDDLGVAYWFIATGVALLALGALARWAVRETGRLPGALGWWLIVVGVPATILMPMSGAFLYAIIGGLTLWAVRSEPAPA